MERKEQLKFCNTCLNKKLDFSKGVICKLTGEIADFERKCIHYEPDMNALKQKKNELKDDVIVAEGRSKALTVFYFLVAISVLSTAFSYIVLREFDTTTIIADTIKLGVEIGLYIAIFNGKNWARMLMTAFLIIGLGISIYFIIVFLLVSQYIILILLPIMFIYVYVIYFIFGDKDFLKYFESKTDRIKIHQYGN